MNNTMLRTSYSRQELADKLKDWLIELWGDNPKNLDPEQRDQWHRDNGMIYHFICDHFPTELDRTEVKQDAPTIPAPPEGFTVWGKGPLTWPSDTFIEDITMICEDEWEFGFIGNSAGDIYALRDGSEIQKLNGRVKP